MTKDEELAMDLALEALENQRTFTLRPDHEGKELTPKQVLDAITAIKQARSAPVQEPVAWRYDLAKYRENDLRGRQWAHSVFSPTKPYIDEMVRNLTPLYTTPPAQRQRIEKLEAELMRMQGRELKLQMALNAPAAQRQWVGLTDEEKQEWVEAMPDEPKPRHIMNLINVIEVELKGRNA